MKKKLKALIAMMSLCAVGTVGSAFALTRTANTVTGNSAQFDQAIYLYWDADSTASAGMTDISSVQTNVPVYRYLTVSPKSTKSVSGTVTLSFSLAAATDKVITGLTVDVYNVDAIPANDAAAASAINGKVAEPALSPSAAAGSTTFAVASSTAHHETVKYYVIKVNYDGTAKGTLGGTVSITQSFAPTAA